MKDGKHAKTIIRWENNKGMILYFVIIIILRR